MKIYKSKITKSTKGKGKGNVVHVHALLKQCNNTTTATKEQKYRPSPAGFEPARAEPNGFQVHRLNHSAKVTWINSWKQKPIFAVLNVTQ